MQLVYTDHNNVNVQHMDNVAGVPPGHHYAINDAKRTQYIEFQNGPVLQNGVNGLTNESLIAVVIHRTKILNSQFPCAENEQAIASLENALAVLEQRTKDRIARQVEGQNKL